MDSTRVEVVSTGTGFGAEIQGVDLRKVRESEFAAIYSAWLEYPVMLFRDQRLADDDLIAFSRRFGELDWAPIQENGRRFVEGYPEIYIVSNVIENGEAIGSLGAGEAGWHTDMSYLQDPPKASILYALEVPTSGGDTHFCSMYHAYESLPAGLRRRVEGLRLKHDSTYNSGGYLREGAVAIDDPINCKGQYHPLVCTHPETGRRLLYLGRRRNAYVDGLTLPESEALLDQLWDFATTETLQWRHAWQVGDLVLWDNRCTVHRRDPFGENTRRVMHRTQIKGETRPSSSRPL